MTREGIPSFLLDCRTNDNISEIEAAYGVKGFAVVVRLWQKIYAEKGYYCEWIERSPLLFLANWFGGNSGVTVSLINEIVSRCLKNGIFDAGMHENYSILTSVRIQEQYFGAVKRRDVILVKKEYLLVSVDNFKNLAYKNEDSVCRNQKNVCRNGTSKVKGSKYKDKDIVSTSEKADVPDDQEHRSSYDKYKPSEFELWCVDYLIKSLLDDLPNQRVPQTDNEKKKWAVHIERMQRLDGLSTEQIQDTLIWAMQDGFWRTNIRSTGKFREKFQTLYLQSRRKTGSSKKNAFNEFEQNEYDFKSLEQELISN